MPLTVAGPVGSAVLFPRTKTRDAVLFVQQMWAFTMVHELPYDDPEALRRRLKIRYPIVVDRIIGGGRLPNARLQEWLDARRRLGRPRSTASSPSPTGPGSSSRTLSLLFILVRDNRSFARAARQMAAAFDLGCVGYIAVPTAPPWWAAENGYTGDDKVERRMVDGRRGDVLGPAWPQIYDAVDGNPWAAMPSLHFGASVLAAILLSESSRTAGAVGWAYAGVLGFALVYLGEHYVARPARRPRPGRRPSGAASRSPSRSPWRSAAASSGSSASPTPERR